VAFAAEYQYALVTMSDNGKEKWITLYSEAMLELTHSLMAGRIMDARNEILKRLEILRDVPGMHQTERQAIQDALSGLRGLEKEELQYANDKQREASRAGFARRGSAEPGNERQTSDHSDQE